MKKVQTATGLALLALLLAVAQVRADATSAFNKLVQAGQKGAWADAALADYDNRSTEVAAGAAETLLQYLEGPELDPGVEAEFLGYFGAGDDKMGLAALKANQAVADIAQGDTFYWDGWTLYGQGSYGEAEAKASNAYQVYGYAVTKLQDAWTLVDEAAVQYGLAQSVLDDL